MTHKYQHLALHEVFIRGMLNNKKNEHRILIKPMSKGKIVGLNKDKIAAIEEVIHRSVMRKDPPFIMRSEIPCPFFVGQRLTIKEKWLCEPAIEKGVQGYNITYLADNHIRFFSNTQIPDNWKPPINQKGINRSVLMPQVFTRLSIIIRAVDIAKLKDITNEQAMAEGVEQVQDSDFYVNYLNKIPNIEAIEKPLDAVSSYFTLWDTTKGLMSRCLDPYVWIINFDVEVKL